jgi:hypothetical protein
VSGAVSGQAGPLFALAALEGLLAGVLQGPVVLYHKRQNHRQRPLRGEGGGRGGRGDPKAGGRNPCAAPPSHPGGERGRSQSAAGATPRFPIWQLGCGALAPLPFGPASCVVGVCATAMGLPQRIGLLGLLDNPNNTSL